MPRTTTEGNTASFKASKNALSNKPIHLYTLYDYDGGGNNLCFAGYDADVVFDGVTYLKFPITHEYVAENTNGEINSLKISISNISRQIQGYLETYDIRGKKITVTMVWADKLNDPTTFIQDTFFIDSYGANADTAEFICAGKFDIMKLELPARKFWRNYCAWKFKSAQCGYAGDETACNKTFQRCGVLGNRVRFGGFPSIPSRTIYVG